MMTRVLRARRRLKPAGLGLSEVAESGDGERGTVRTVAGMDVLERVGRELEAEVSAERAAAHRLQCQVAELSAQVRDLGLKEQSLARLDQSHRAQAHVIAAQERELDSLARAQEQVCQVVAMLDSQPASAEQDAPGRGVRLLDGWKAGGERLAVVLAAVDSAADAAVLQRADGRAGGLKTATMSMQALLARMEDLVRGCLRGRDRLAGLTGQSLGAEPPSLCEAHARLTTRIDEVYLRRLHLLRRRTAWWSFLFKGLALSGAALIIAAMTEARIPGWLSVWWSDIMPSTLFPDSPVQASLVPAAMVVVGLVELVLWVRTWFLSRRLHTLQRQSALLGEQIARARQARHVLDNLDTAGISDTAAVLRAGGDEHLARLLAGFGAYRGEGMPALSFREAMVAWAQEVRSVNVAMAEGVQELRAALDLDHQEQAQAGRVLARDRRNLARARQRRLKRLDLLKQRLAQEQPVRERSVRLRRVALDLVAAAREHWGMPSLPGCDAMVGARLASRRPGADSRKRSGRHKQALSDTGGRRRRAAKLCI